jgi:hypothetical protein
MTLNKLLLNEDNDYKDEVEVIEGGDWEINYKDYMYKQEVVKFNDKFYTVTHNRSGSYYSYYEYGDIDIIEVKPVQVTVTQYVKI